MIFSKPNFSVASVASKDDTDPGLNCVRLNGDGSTVATNGRVIVAVGPVDRNKVSYPSFTDQASPGVSGVSVPLDMLQKVQKIIPKEKRAQLQCVAMTRADDPGEIELTTTDLKHLQRVAGRPVGDDFPAWEGLLRKVKGSDGVRVCVRRAELIAALAALDDACPDKGDTDPVFIEIHPESQGMVLRCINRETNQRAVAGLAAYDTQGKWMPCDPWERKVFGVKLVTPKGE